MLVAVAVERRDLPGSHRAKVPEDQRRDSPRPFLFSDVAAARGCWFLLRAPPQPPLPSLSLFSFSPHPDLNIDLILSVADIEY